MYYLLALLSFLSACQYLPKVADDIEAIATDTAIKVEISRGTFQKETDLSISIRVQNKDEPAPAVSK